MEKIKNFAFNKPFLFSLLLFFVSLFLTELPLDKALTAILDERMARYIGWTVLQLIGSALLVWLLIRIDLFKNVGFTSPGKWKDIWVIWPLVLLTVLNGSALFDGSLVIDTSRPVHILFYTLFYISVGLFEEILGRGVVLFVMLKKWGTSRKGVYKAILVSSTLFMLGHITNFIQGRYSLLACLTQMALGLFFGVYFAVCMLRNRSIWPVIILHALFDFAGALEEISVGGKLFGEYYTVTWESALVTILIALPLFLYGLFLARRVSPPFAVEAVQQV